MVNKVVLPAFSSNTDVSPFDMRQLVSALELRFQSLESNVEGFFPSIEDDLFSPIGHTHVESEITDLQSYITDITAESIFDLADVDGTPAQDYVLVWETTQNAFVAQSPGAASAVSLDDLTDVSVPAPNDGEVLTYNNISGQWEALATAAASATLVDLLDTDMAGQMQYDLLFNADGSEWQPTGQEFQWFPSQYIQLGNLIGVNWYDSTATSTELLLFDDSPDPFDADTTDSIPFTGADTDTTYTSPGGNVFTFVTNAEISTDQFFDSPSSYRGDGAATTYIHTPNTDFLPGAADFTIECMVFTETAGQQPLMGVYGAATDRAWMFWQGTNRVCEANIYTEADGLQQLQGATFQVTEDVWEHWCLERVDTTVSLYLEGVLQDSVTVTSGSPLNDSTGAPTTVFRVGSIASSGTYMTGFVDNVRMTFGSVRYGAPFTPPTDFESAAVSKFVVGDPGYLTEIDGTQLDINANTYLNTGSSLTIWDATDTDNAVFSHDGTDFLADYTNTAYVRSTGAAQEYRFDRDIRVTDADAGLSRLLLGDPTPTASNSNDGHLILFGENSGAVSGAAISNPSTYMQLGGSSEGGATPVTTMRSQLHIDIYGGGSHFRMWDAAIDSSMLMEHSGVDFNTTFSVVDEWNIDGLTNGTQFLDSWIRINDTGAANQFITMDVTGDAFGMTAAVGVTQFNIDVTSFRLINDTDLDIRSGASFFHRGATVGNVATFTHDDTNYNTTFANTVDWDITGLTGEVFIDTDLRTSGDLTVGGTTTTINSNTVSIADNIILLNSDAVDPPSEDAGIEIERGGVVDNVQVLWNETTDRWTFTNDGTTYHNMLIDGDTPAFVDPIALLDDALTTPPTDGTFGHFGGFEIWDNDQTDKLAHFGYDNDLALEVRNLVHGGRIQFLGETTAGSEVSMGILDPDGDITFSYAGGPKLFGTRGATGFNIWGATDVAAGAKTLVFTRSLNGTDGSFGYNGTDFVWNNAVDGSRLIMEGDNTGSLNRNMLIADPDLGVTLYGGDNTPEVSTTTGFFTVLDGSTFRIEDGTSADFADFSHDGTDFNIVDTNTETIAWSSAAAGAFEGAKYSFTETRDMTAADVSSVFQIDATTDGSNQARTYNVLDMTMTNALANMDGVFVKGTGVISSANSIYRFLEFETTIDSPNASPSMQKAEVTSAVSWTTSRFVKQNHNIMNMPATSTVNFNQAVYGYHTEINAGSTDWNTGANAAKTRYYGFRSDIDAFNSDNVAAYGLYLVNGTARTSHYGVYQASTGVSNYFASNVSIGAAANTVPATELDIEGTLRVRDDGGTDYADFSHNGTDFNTAFTQTDNWDISNLGEMWLRDGAVLRLYDSTDTDSITHAMVGAQYRTVGTGSNTWAIQEFANFALQDGVSLALYGPGDVNRVNFTHDDTTLTQQFTTTANWVIQGLSLDDATGNETAMSFSYTVNKATSGDDTGFLINKTDTLSQGTSLLADWQVGGVTKFSWSANPTFTMYDDTGADSAAFNLDGTDYNTVFAGTVADWNITGLTGRIKQGAETLAYLSEAGAGTVTDVTGGVGIDSSGGATPDISLNLSELSVTVPVTGDWLAFDDAGTSSKALISAIPLSIFNDDLGHVENATHTGQVTGATALALDVTAITAQPASGAIVDADTILTNDGGVLSETTFTQLNTYFDANLDFAASAHTHLLAAGATDVTATFGELNLLDLAGLTAGWVLSADTATTASWKAQTGGALDDLTDVDTTGVATFDMLYKSAGDWLDTAGLLTWNGAQTLAINAATATIQLNVPSSASLSNIAWRVASDTKMLMKLDDVVHEFIFEDRDVGNTDRFIMEMDTGHFRLETGTLFIAERTNADTDLSTYGQFWTRDDAPGQTPMWTGDDGVDVALNAGAQISGTPANNQLAVWTGATDIEGDAALTWDGSLFRIYDSGDDDFLQMTHTGSEILFTSAGTGVGGVPIVFQPSAAADFIGVGGDSITAVFRVMDGAETSYADFSHDATDFNTDLTSTTDWNITGCRVVTPASTTGRSGFNVPEGSTPSSPADGDIWITGTAGFVRINGVSYNWAGGVFNDMQPAQYVGLSNQTLSTTTITVDLATEVYDPDGKYSVASDVITIDDAGYYQVSYQVYCRVASGSGNVQCAVSTRITLNGTVTPLASSWGTGYINEANNPIDGASPGAVFMHRFSASDTIRIRADLNQNTDVDTVASKTYLYITKIRQD